jgi:hypothetical protein
MKNRLLLAIGVFALLALAVWQGTSIAQTARPSSPPCAGPRCQRPLAVIIATSRNASLPSHRTLARAYTGEPYMIVDKEATRQGEVKVTPLSKTQTAVTFAGSDKAVFVGTVVVGTLPPIPGH